jgi:hypothetical protein
MSRFANLADKPIPRRDPETPRDDFSGGAAASDAVVPHKRQAPSSRAGRKAIAGYFSQEMSLAMNVCARRQSLSLQELMAEAFNDVLRKYGESSIGA